MIKQRPFISIIIPHYNDSERLACCLRELENQTYPTDCYEIIVVDNGSDVMPQSVVSQFPHSHLVVEAKPSSYAARNKGLSVAKGEIIAFTDADCLPRSNWLEKGANALMQHDNIGLVSGQVNLFPADPNVPTVAEIYEQIFGFPIENYVKNLHFGVTANLFTRRKIIDEVGELNNALKSGGDFEWGWRVYGAGHENFYGEDVVVDHPARNDVWAIYSKKRRVQGGLHDLSVQHNPLYNYLWENLAKDILPPLRRSRKLLSKSQFSLSTRLQLVMLEWVCNYVIVFETLRLLLGGGSVRE